VLNKAALDVHNEEAASDKRASSARACRLKLPTLDGGVDLRAW
jgi:hypothetical protein